MAMQLPPSLDRTRHTVDREVARMRGLTPEERLIIVARVCKAATRQLEMHPKREVVLAMRDPIPESTRALRREARDEVGPVDGS